MGGALRTSLDVKVNVIVVCVILAVIICFHYYIRQHIHQILNRRYVPVTRGVIVRNLPNNAIIITIEEKT
jgi:hypothetical protein